MKTKADRCVLMLSHAASYWACVAAADDMDEMVHAVKHAIQQCCLQVCRYITPAAVLHTVSCAVEVSGRQQHHRVT